MSFDCTSVAKKTHVRPLVLVSRSTGSHMSVSLCFFLYEDIAHAIACLFNVRRSSVYAGKAILVGRATQSYQYLFKIYTLSTISTDFMFSWF